LQYNIPFNEDEEDVQYAEEEHNDVGLPIYIGRAQNRQAGQAAREALIAARFT
jgi:hypothetical protein